MNRIYQKQGEIRIEAETRDTFHIVAGPSTVRPKVITIEAITRERVMSIYDDDVIDLWVTDIDPLINALLDMKRELLLEYGEANGQV